MRNAGHLMEHMEGGGNGFLDRFIISIPKSLPATPAEQRQAAAAAAGNSDVTIGTLYSKIDQFLKNNQSVVFQFAPDAQQ